MNNMYNVQNYFWQGHLIRLRPSIESDWEMKYQEYLDTEARRFEEGRQRRAIYTGGQYIDNLLFGMTREEFDEKHMGGNNQ